MKHPKALIVCFLLLAAQTHARDEEKALKFLKNHLRSEIKDFKKLEDEMKKITDGAHHGKGYILKYRYKLWDRKAEVDLETGVLPTIKAEADKDGTGVSMIWRIEF